MPDYNKTFGTSTSTRSAKVIDMNYTSALVTQSIFVAPWPCIVSHIRGRPRVAGSDGSAVSLSFFKVPNGIAVGSGTLLHSGSYDMKGTADTNQLLTLVSNTDSLTLAAGDAIGYVLTGTATNAVGCITVTVEPIS